MAEYNKSSIVLKTSLEKSLCVKDISMQASALCVHGGIKIVMCKEHIDPFFFNIYEKDKQ